MKKTLTLSIALLSGLASAADLELTLEEAITTHTTANNIDTWAITKVTTTSANKNYAYVALLNLESFKDALAKGSLNNKKILSENHSNFGLGVTNSDTLTFCNIKTNADVTTAEKNIWGPTNQNVILSSSLLTRNTSQLAGAALTFSVGHASNPETTGVAGISLLYQDGSVVNIYGSNSSYKASNFSNDGMTSMAGLVDSISVYSGTPAQIATITNLATVSQQVIAASVPEQPMPEPATATLSLLALAGLAARRRR